MKNSLSLYSHSLKRLERKIPNSWTLTVIFTVFALSIHRLFFKVKMRPTGDWQEAASVYGLLFKKEILSLELLESTTLFWIFNWSFLITICLWFAFKRYRSWSMFFCFLFYTLACSHHLENIPRASSHTGNILSLSLLVLFLGHVFDFKNIKLMDLKDFSNEKTTSYLIPFALKGCLFLIYSISGFYKLFRSGFSWAEASNIQTYLHFFSLNTEQTAILSFALESASVAALLGICVLLLECLAFTGIFNEVLGMLLGVLFIGFHLSITYFFGWTFFSHVFLLILVASPVALIWLNPNKSPHFE